jgi:excisionase family DNA binding protein
MAGAGRTHQGRRMERRGSHVDEPSAGSSHIPRLVDITTIAAHLDVSVRHVRRLVAERRIPYVKWGNLLRFDPVAVADWLGREAIPPADARRFHDRRSG